MPCDTGRCDRRRRGELYGEKIGCRGGDAESTKGLRYLHLLSVTSKYKKTSTCIAYIVIRPQTKDNLAMHISAL